MATSTLSQNHTATSTITVPTTILDPRPHLPLTTIYTPPPSCSSIVTWDGTHLWQFGTNQTGGDCYPPKFRSIYNSYYSPGICPHGWTSAGSVQTFTGFDAMCCPKDFFLSGLSRGYECASVFYHALSGVYSTSRVGNDTITGGAPLTTIDPHNSRAFMVADAIQVQWQATDKNIISLMSERVTTSETQQAARSGARSSASTADTTITSKTSSSSSGGASQSSLTPTPTASNPSAAGLPTGTKIAIGVTVPLVVLTFLGIAIYLLFRRRKKRAALFDDTDHHKSSPLRQDQQMSFSSREPLPQELAGQLSPELEGHSPYELGVPSHELSAGETVAEIGGEKIRDDSAEKGPSILERIAQKVRMSPEQ